MSEWKRDGVWGVGRSYPNERPLPSTIGPADVARPAAPHQGAERPIRGAKEPHGKRNYVAVFAFETFAFAGACSKRRYLSDLLTGISQLRSGGKWRGRPGFRDVRPWDRDASVEPESDRRGVRTAIHPEPTAVKGRGKPWLRGLAISFVTDAADPTGR